MIAPLVIPEIQPFSYHTISSLWAQRTTVFFLKYNLVFYVEYNKKNSLSGKPREQVVCDIMGRKKGPTVNLMRYHRKHFCASKPIDSNTVLKKRIKPVPVKLFRRYRRANVGPERNYNGIFIVSVAKLANYF